MIPQLFKRALAAVFATALFAPSFVSVQAQDADSLLKITRPQPTIKQNSRVTPTVSLDRAATFRRIEAGQPALTGLKRERQRGTSSNRLSAFAAAGRVAAALTAQSFGTGGGDISELEPNDRVAQGVSLPVNIFGETSFDGDVDFFAFQGIAGQQITIEPFAARVPGSELIADIALFDSSGRLLAFDTGDEESDPLIRFIPSSNEVLVIGIADADEFGGSRFDYLLNITRGIDVDEDEPNGTRAQSLPGLPATVFGEIDGTTDVDFYSFTASAGQTLIVDVDAEVFGSRLDPEINLLDPESGVEFFYNDQYDGDDARFNIVLPYTGRYVIGIGAFSSDSEGFYRLNASVVSSSGAPLITSVTRISSKNIEVAGSGFATGSRVEVNGVRRKTTRISSGTLRAKVKARAGDVVTVSNSPDERRSNPLIVQ